MHEIDMIDGYGQVWLPHALAVKYPSAATELGRQYLFPAAKRSIDPRSNSERRHHFDETSLQRAVKKAIRLAGILKHADCHTFRHSGVHPPVFWRTTHLAENGYDIRTVQGLLGHADVRTTMVNTHVLNKGGLGVKSPLDV